MTRGIVFYLFGNNMDAMLPASIYSLRANYSGPVHFVCSNVSEWFKTNIAALPNCTWSKELDNRYSISLRHVRTYRPAIFCRKAYHHIADYPFDMNLYMDLDMLWQMPMDNHPIFDLCEQAGLVAVTQTSIGGRFLANRCKAMNDVFNMHMDTMQWAHTGAVCAIKNCGPAEEWVRRIDRLRGYNGKYTYMKLDRSAEELPLSTMLTEGIISAVAPETICFPVGPRGLYKKRYPSLAGINIHGVGGSCVYLKRYWDTYRLALDCNYMDMDSILTDGLKASFANQARAAYST